MRSIITSVTLALTIGLFGLFGVAGCGSDSGAASCEKVTEHFLSVAPPELKDQLGDKKAMIEQCEKKMSPEQRKCAMAAKNMEAIMKCQKAKG